MDYRLNASVVYRFSMFIFCRGKAPIPSGLDEDLLFDTDLPIPSVSEDEVIPVTKVRSPHCVFR